MAWWDNLATMLTGMLTNPASAQAGQDILNALSNQSKTNAQVNNLLMQVQANPAEAGVIAATIAAMPNIPAAVMALVNQLPVVAGDKVQLALLIAQIQAALPHSNLFGN